MQLNCHRGVEHQSDRVSYDIVAQSSASQYLKSAYAIERWTPERGFGIPDKNVKM